MLLESSYFLSCYFFFLEVVSKVYVMLISFYLQRSEDTGQPEMSYNMVS